MSIANKALLASVKISKWSGRKHDKRATATVENAHSTKGKVGNYNKKLLPGADELSEITNQAQAMREFFYEETLPWCNDGARILAAKNYLDFTKKFNTRKESFDKAVSAFLKAYPGLQAKAAKSLGKLYNASEYPSVAELREYFDCQIQFSPVPEASDFRVEISKADRKAFEKQMRETEAAAMQDAWRRLYDIVSKAAAKLDDPKGIFRDSMMENIAECCTLLGRLNIAEDPNLEQMRKEVEKLASKISPDSCRVSEVSRTEAAEKLHEITARMGAFMAK